MEQQTTQTYNFTNEEIDQVYRILYGVVRRKHPTFKYYAGAPDIEDVVNDIWLKVIEECNRVMRCDMNLVARKAYTYCVDVVRTLHRRNHESLDSMELEVMQDRTSGVEDLKHLHSNTVSQFDYAVIEEIRELFPEGSRERIYINAIIDIEALPTEIDPEDLKHLNSIGSSKRNTYPLESFLAQKCGYKYTGNSGYRLMKERIKAKLIEAGYFED